MPNNLSRYPSNATLVTRQTTAYMFTLSKEIATVKGDHNGSCYKEMQCKGIHKGSLQRTYS